MVDAGSDRDGFIQSFGADFPLTYQQDRFDRVQSMLRDADRIVLTHEHFDHALGVQVEEGPFARPLSHQAPFPDLPRWEAGKHLVWLMGNTYARLLSIRSASDRADAVVSVVEGSIALVEEIRNEGVEELKDGTDTYQEPWRNALARLKADAADDYTMLDLF